MGALKKLVATATLAIALAFVAPSAYAGGNSVLSGHTSQPTAAQVLHPKKPSVGRVAGTTTGPTKSPGTLPFTGFDLSVAAVVSALLLGAGTVLLRAGRSTR